MDSQVSCILFGRSEKERSVDCRCLGKSTYTVM